MKSPHKHIPPTAHPPLVSLTWLAPGHTFKTTYAPGPGGNSDASQHIVFLDTKAATGTYVAPNHPFPIPDRNQEAFTIVLPRWDEDASSNASKSLVIVGDKSSVDLEVLGNVDVQWYQQSQENPLSLPLDKNMEDTILVSLDVDLTDTTSSFPRMFAYLNDGTLQGWVLEHTKPYPGIVSPQSVSLSADQMSATPTAAATEALFGQQATFPSSFGRKPPGSTFAQPTPAFGMSGFGQQPTFGSPTGPAPAFGSATGTSAFGGGSTFGTTGFGGTSPSAFGGAPSTSPFGNTLGSSANPTGGAFSAFANKSSTTNAFGQPSFGFGTPTSTTSAPSAPEMTREESMSDATEPSFGGLSLGVDSNADSSKAPKTGIFGSVSPTPATTTSAFGASLVKPATGFGAFGNFKPAQATQLAQSNTETPTTAFGTPLTSKPASAFGQPSFGTTSLGQPSFGQPSFGQTKSPTTTSSSASGGFAAFAATPTSFGGAAAQQTSGSASAFGSTAKSTSPGTGGFGAFASATPTAFGAPSSTGPVFGATPDSSPFSTVAASEPSKLPFASGVSSGAPPFGAQSNTPFLTNKESPTTKTPFASPPHSSVSAPRLGTATIDSENETSPPPAFKTASSTGFFGATTTPTTTPAGGAFGNIQTSPSVFKPATGFGAFGSDKTPSSSPFFKAAVEPKTPSVSAFRPSGLASTTTPPSVQAATTPTFGSSSSLGTFKSPFAQASPTPTTMAAKAPASGGFGAFSGSPNTFSAFAGPKKSFGELLKDGDKDAKPTKPTIGSTLAFEAKKEEREEKAETPRESGSDKTPSSSPFFKAAVEPKTPGVSAFGPSGLASTTTPPSIQAATTPTFGSSSPLGAFKSPFAQASPTPTTVAATAPASGGFGAFSGSPGTFGAFAGPKKSFGELLKDGDKDTEPTKPTTGSTLAFEAKKEEKVETPREFTGRSSFRCYLRLS